GFDVPPNPFRGRNAVGEPFGRNGVGCAHDSKLPSGKEGCSLSSTAGTAHADRESRRSRAVETCCRTTAGPVGQSLELTSGGSSSGASEGKWCLMKAQSGSSPAHLRQLHPCGQVRQSKRSPPTQGFVDSRFSGSPRISLEVFSGGTRLGSWNVAPVIFLS